jgi:hypothetical protein
VPEDADERGSAAIEKLVRLSNTMLYPEMDQRISGIRNRYRGIVNAVGYDENLKEEIDLEVLERMNQVNAERIDAIIDFYRSVIRPAAAACGYEAKFKVIGVDMEEQRFRDYMKNDPNGFVRDPLEFYLEKRSGAGSPKPDIARIVKLRATNVKDHLVLDRVRTPDGDQYPEAIIEISRPVSSLQQELKSREKYLTGKSKNFKTDAN